MTVLFAAPVALFTVAVFKWHLNAGSRHVPSGSEQHLPHSIPGTLPRIFWSVIVILLLPPACMTRLVFSACNDIMRCSSTEGTELRSSTNFQQNQTNKAELFECCRITCIHFEGWRWASCTDNNQAFGGHFVFYIYILYMCSIYVDVSSANASGH